MMRSLIKALAFGLCVVIGVVLLVLVAGLCVAVIAATQYGGAV